MDIVRHPHADFEFPQQTLPSSRMGPVWLLRILCAIVFEDSEFRLLGSCDSAGGLHLLLQRHVSLLAGISRVSKHRAALTAQNAKVI